MGENMFIPGFETLKTVKIDMRLFSIGDVYFEWEYFEKFYFEMVISNLISKVLFRK